jgi:hypothetical protein
MELMLYLLSLMNREQMPHGYAEAFRKVNHIGKVSAELACSKSWNTFSRCPAPS